MTVRFSAEACGLRVHASCTKHRSGFLVITTRPSNNRFLDGRGFRDRNLITLLRFLVGIQFGFFASQPRPVPSQP
jgi:hypothetical protein